VNSYKPLKFQVILTIRFEFAKVLVDAGGAIISYMSHIDKEFLHMKQRYCRVCGEPFMARRFDALTCTSTCWMRKARGYDLAYLATLPDYLVEARRFLHEADLDAIATARAAAKREGRAQRRELPRVESTVRLAGVPSCRRLPRGAPARWDKAARRSGLPLRGAGQPVGQGHGRARRVVGSVLVDRAAAVVDGIFAGGQIVVRIRQGAA
jgi:hypothetical protein